MNNIPYVKPTWYRQSAGDYARFDDEQIINLATHTRSIDQQNREIYQRAIQGREGRRAAALRKGDEREALRIAREKIEQPESWFQRWLKFKNKIITAREERCRLDHANELARIRKEKARQLAAQKREREARARKEAEERHAAERAEFARRASEGRKAGVRKRLTLDKLGLLAFDDLCLLDGVDPALMWAWALSVDEAFEYWRDEAVKEADESEVK